MTRVDRVTQVQPRKSPGAPVPLPAPPGAAWAGKEFRPALAGGTRDGERRVAASTSRWRSRDGEPAVLEPWGSAAFPVGPRADRRRGRVSESRCWVSTRMWMARGAQE